MKYYLYLILLPAGIGISFLLGRFPSIVEKYYSGKVYPLIGEALSCLTAWLPVSVAELLLLNLLVLSMYWLIKFLADRYKQKKNKLQYKKLMVQLMSAAGGLYICFLLLWGINYYRLPFSEIAGLDTDNISLRELEGLCEQLIIDANEMRMGVNVDEQGVMILSGPKREVLRKAFDGYKAAAVIYRQLAGEYSYPKPVIFSKVMSYAGIPGVFFPFTGEANVDVDIPDVMIPVSACHEMAHQRGFAREDEANYIAYYVSRLNPDLDYQYSGVILALRYSMNNLAVVDRDKYLNLRKRYSEGVVRDLAAIDSYWLEHRGIIWEISNYLNDIYLKANQQEAGVASYGGVVKLLVAERRSAAV